MSLTYIKATIINPAQPKRQATMRFLVDSGAAYTIAPRTVLSRLGIKPRRKRVFTLADGTEIVREMGNAVFAVNGEEAASPVIFGEKGDSQLFGTVSLEALGFILDPIRRELRPMPMLFG